MKSGAQKLKLLHSPQPAIDMGAGELAHIFFSLQVSWETALAGEFDFVPVFKIDMTAPCPCIGIRIFSHDADKGLIAMRILNPVSLPVFWAGFHIATVLVVVSHSKRNPGFRTGFSLFTLTDLTLSESVMMKTRRLFLLRESTLLVTRLS